MGERDFEKKICETKNAVEKTTFRIGKVSVGLTAIIMYVFCLLCAIVIWANVNENSTEKVTREFGNIPVVIEGESVLAKNNMAVFEVFDKTVNVSVEGAKNKINKLSDSDIVAYVDVSEITEAGTARLNIGIKGTGKLDTVASPSSVKVFVDEKCEIDVPVEVKKIYSIDSEYGFDVKTDIDSVAVSGAKSVLDKVKSAVCEADLGKLTTSFTKTEKLVLVDENGEQIDMSYVTVGISYVQVGVEVYTEKTVPLTVSYKYGYIMPKNISVTLTPPEITIKGDPAVLADIDSILLHEIDETKITGDTFSALNVTLPAGVTEVEKKEISEDIKLIRTEKHKIDYPVSSITVLNPNGIDYEFVGDTIEIEYIVATDSKSRVTKKNFEVELDLSDYESEMSGSYRIPINVNVTSTGYTLFPINIGQSDVRLSGTDK